MRFRSRFVLVVSAAVMMAGLSGIWTTSALGKESDESQRAGSSQTEREFRLFEQLSHQFEQGLPVTDAEKEEYLALESRYGDMRGRDGLDNQGGPDAFQYVFMDNVPPDDVPYEWIELRGDADATWLPGSSFVSGTTINVDDGYTRTRLPIGFAFPFYGASYDCVRVCTNGFLQFTTTSTSLSNACLPNTGVAGPMIAMFWDDLQLLNGGRTDTVVVGYHGFGDYFVVEFDQIGFYNTLCPNIPLKFEAVLYPNGNIKLQYATAVPPTSCLNSQSIGIQQAGAVGSAALNYICNGTGIQPTNGLAIMFARATGVPNPVTDLTAQYVAPNAVLNWNDPTHDTQGNPITPTNIQVWLGPAETGTLLATVSPGAGTYVHFNAPSGHLTYTVRPFHDPYYGAATSIPLTVGAPGYTNNFDSNNGQWVATPATGGWEWGIPWGVSGLTPHSLPNVWGTVVAGNYTDNACWQLDLNLGLVVTSEAATVEFYHWFYSQASYDGCNFKVSVDNGATWTVLTPTSGGYSTTALLTTTCMTGQPAWAETTPWTWQRCVIPIGQYVGQVPIFRFEFSSNTSTSTYPGFYFDDFEIWGVSGQQGGIPQACTNLVGSYAEPDVVLMWNDPTLDSQGNPLSVDSVQIWLGTAGTGTRLGSVDRGVQTFTHLGAPIGFQTYSVRPCHDSFYGPPVSVTMMVGNPAYLNDFEVDDGSWVPDPPTGGWEWGVPTYASGPTAHSGTKVWGTVLASTYAASACYKLTLTPNMTVSSSDARVEFWRWVYTEQAYDGVNFKVSVDQGATWTLVQPVGNYPYTASTANVCIPGEPYWAGIGGTWAYVVLPIGQFLGQMPMFRFTFGSDPSVVYAGFYFDDMVIWGMGNVSGVPRPPTNLSGNYAGSNVTLTWTDPNQDINGGPITVDSIQVWLGQVGTGTRLGSVGPGVQTYIHLNAPVGIQTYGIRAYNDSYPSTAVSVSVTVGNPSYVNDFNVNDGGWVPDPPTGGWSWGAPTNPSAPAPHSSPNYWGTGLTANYTASVDYKLDYNPGSVVQDAAGYVEFWYRFDTELTYDGCNFKASVDNGSTWTVLTPSEGAYTVASMHANNVFMGGQPGWSGHGQTAWQHATIPIGSLVGQTPIFRFEFSSDPIVINYAGFFFDDLLIWGLAAPVGIPRAVTNLAGNYVAPNVVLTWTDPNQDMTGLPLTPDSIQIWLGTLAAGQRIGAVAAGVQTFTHLNPPAGTITYTVRPFASPYYGAAVSVSVQGAPPVYPNDFESDNGGWVPDPATGGWERGVPTYASGPTAHSGTKVWGTVLAGTYAVSACYKLTLARNLSVRSPDASIEFWRWWDTEANYDGCNFKVSTDQGSTWTTVEPTGGYGGTTNTSNACIPSEPAWTGHTGGAWTLVTIPLGQFLGQTPWFRFTFSSDASINYPGFYFDDMNIWGLRPPSSITGTVRAFLSNRPIAGARVWATDWPDTAVTDSAGSYELGMDPGTYSVTVDHVHFCDTTFANVVVVQGGQTDRDAVLRWPVAQITRTSIAFLTFPGVDVSDTFRISNSGGHCPLDFAITDTSEWLTVDPASGTINPNESVVVTVSADAPEIVGDYSSSLTVTYNAVGTPSVIHVDLSTVDAAGERGVIPTEFAYYQNYPNPFNAQTSLHFDVPQQSRVQITIYNIMGQEVARPVDRPFGPGRYRVLYDASGLPSGMYLVKMTAADYAKIGKMMLLK